MGNSFHTELTDFYFFSRCNIFRIFSLGKLQFLSPSRNNFQCPSKQMTVARLRLNLAHFCAQIIDVFTSFFSGAYRPFFKLMTRWGYSTEESSGQTFTVEVFQKWFIHFISVFLSQFEAFSKFFKSARIQFAIILTFILIIFCNFLIFAVFPTILDHFNAMWSFFK